MLRWVLGYTVFIRDQSLGNEGEEAGLSRGRSQTALEVTGLSPGPPGPFMSPSQSVTGHVSPGQDMTWGEVALCS